MSKIVLVGAAAAATASFCHFARNSKRAATADIANVPFVSYSVQPKTLRLLAPLDDGYPSGELGVHFDVHTGETLVVTPESLKPNHVLVKLLAVSADPYQRGRIKSKNPLTGGSSTTEQQAAEPRAMSGFVAGKILASRHPKWKPGDLFGAALPITTVMVIDLSSNAFVWPLRGITEEQVSLGVGVLGMPGSTAYGGLIGCLRPKRGETLYVSGAAGAVGSLVGELGKSLFDLKVIGSCGGPDKCARIVESHGFDVAIDRKKLPKWGSDGDWTASKEALRQQLQEAAGPGGIDMYFDNVGADHFEAAFESLGKGGRVAICGQIASYNDKSTRHPTIYPGRMIYTLQRIEGILSFPWLSGKQGNFHEDMARWLREGKVTPHETRFDGLESWPQAFRSLFVATEKKNGKVVVILDDDDFAGEDIIQ